MAQADELSSPSGLENKATRIGSESKIDVRQIDTTDFIQGFINAIQHARFDIIGEQDFSDYKLPQTTLSQAFRTKDPVSSFLDTSTDIVSSLFGNIVDTGRIRALVRNLSDQFVPLIDLRQEIFAILLCCEQPNRETQVSIKDRLSPSALKDLESEITLMGSSLSVINIIKMQMIDQLELDNPVWLYEGVIAPEKTGCVITHEEGRFLLPFSEYAASQIPAERLIRHLEKIGRIYERDIHMNHPEIEVENYSKNFKKVKSDVQDFMEKRKMNFLERGATILTERFNDDRTKYSPADFVFFPRKFKMSVILKYLQSGNEDDFYDNMLDSHCQVLCNIYNNVINMEFGSILPAIDRAEQFGSQVLTTILDDRVVHEDVD